MKRKKRNRIGPSRGIAIYIAIIVSATLVLVSAAIINIAVKQSRISTFSSDSEGAFYAADSGIECALFWDLKNPTNPSRSAFATSTGIQAIQCSNNTINPTRTVSGSGTGTTTFSFVSPSPDLYCTTVSVVKSYLAGTPKTKIESRGYNEGTVSGHVCVGTTDRRVERAILVNY